ncbi:MAG: aromatic ring-hydroxylating dioxygenase subunit alpha [Actinomycetota bacterium]|nr:aromatic ring-hydroxylating dioxygenase subunit alpha [Actinomycetota bacterium]
MTDLSALVEPHRVHRSIYVEPDIFAQEMEKIFGGTWVYLAHESQVAEPNDFLTVRLGHRPVILTRDADGELHGLLNRCAHRAATVCNEECGSAKNFQCSYHGWTYSNRGDLVNVPFADGYPADFDKSDYGLSQIPSLGTYRGVIFGTLNPDPSSLLDWLGPAAPLIDGFVDRSPTGRIELRNRQRMIYRGNWKLAWDNAGDGLHPTFAHRSFVLHNENQHGGERSLSQFKSSPDDTGMYGEDLGNGHMFVDQRPGLTGSFWETQRPVPGHEWYADRIESEYGDSSADVLEMVPGSMVNLSIFPNLLIKGNHIETIDPISVDETRLHTWVATAEGAPDEVNVMRMRIAEDFPSLGNPDDLELFERCQEGLGVSEVEWVDMSKGLGHPSEQVSANGVRRGPVTHEGPMRGYIRAWLELMDADPKRVAVDSASVKREVAG